MKQPAATDQLLTSRERPIDWQCMIEWPMCLNDNLSLNDNDVIEWQGAIEMTMHEINRILLMRNAIGHMSMGLMALKMSIKRTNINQ